MIFKQAIYYLILTLFCLSFWFILVLEHFNIFIGIPVAIVASIISTYIFGQYLQSFNIFNAFLFFIFYLKKSFLAGIDVAFRALSYNMPIDPEIIRYDFKYTTGFFRILFCWAVTLMPGTLSMKYKEDFVLIHVLTYNGNILGDLDIIEKRIGKIQNNKRVKS